MLKIQRNAASSSVEAVLEESRRFIKRWKWPNRQAFQAPNFVAQDAFFHCDIRDSGWSCSWASGSQKHGAQGGFSPGKGNFPSLPGPSSPPCLLGRVSLPKMLLLSKSRKGSRRKHATAWQHLLDLHSSKTMVQYVQSIPWIAKSFKLVWEIYYFCHSHKNFHSFFGDI